MLSSFSERLKELRKQNNVTQKMVAEAIGISERSYINLENDRYKPNYENIIKLAIYFGVSSDNLLCLNNYWLDNGQIKVKAFSDNSNSN